MMPNGLTRRARMGALGVAAAGPALAMPRPRQSPPTYVLVHGAWHGGWCWSRVRPFLEAAGARVHVPTLTGLGERAHLREPIPSLETHIRDVAALIETEELTDLALVGHSYAGMVITAVADRLAPRVRSLVYLDAAVPRDGQDLASHAPGMTQAGIDRRRAAFRAMAGGGDWLPPPAAGIVGVTHPDDVAWLSRRMTPQPLRTFLDPVSLHGEATAGIPKTFIVATRPPTNMMGYPAQAEAARGRPGWTVREMACGHDMMIIDPAGTARMILEAGRG